MPHADGHVDLNLGGCGGLPDVTLHLGRDSYSAEIPERTLVMIDFENGFNKEYYTLGE